MIRLLPLERPKYAIGDAASFAAFCNERFITDEEQQLRFLVRIHDPMKQWKLSPMDLQSRVRWEQYTKAKEDMLARTNIPEAPWYIVEADNKKRARLNCMRHFLSTFDYPDKDESVATPPDPLIVRQASHVIGQAEHILAALLHPETRKS